MKIATTYAELAALVAEGAGPRFVERIMDGYVDPVVDLNCGCDRCGAVIGIGLEDRHLDWHRMVTLGMRCRGFDLLGQMLRDEAAKAGD